MDWSARGSASRRGKLTRRSPLTVTALAGVLRAVCEHRLDRRVLQASLANPRQRRSLLRRASLGASLSRRSESPQADQPITALTAALTESGAGRSDPVDFYDWAFGQALRT
jgi:hypothetical protein